MQLLRHSKHERHDCVTQVTWCIEHTSVSFEPHTKPRMASMCKKRKKEKEKEKILLKNLAARAEQISDRCQSRNKRYYLTTDIAMLSNSAGDASPSSPAAGNNSDRSPDDDSRVGSGGPGPVPATVTGDLLEDGDPVDAPSATDGSNGQSLLFVYSIFQ